MTFVVTEACILCKYTDCVSICPVDCFHEGANMLVIDPELCIDCGVCVPECPANAIIADTEPGASKWLELNQEMALLWPVISEKSEPLGEADTWKDVTGKFEPHFSREPGR